MSENQAKGDTLTLKEIAQLRLDRALWAASDDLTREEIEATVGETLDKIKEWKQ